MGECYANPRELANMILHHDPHKKQEGQGILQTPTTLKIPFLQNLTTFFQ